MDGDVLQAVVLADSFDAKFYPITLEMPRVRAAFPLRTEFRH
jgi:hypothetical protein